MSEDFRIRRQDFNLSDEQVALQESFRAYFDKTVPASRVRAAEPDGFDKALWDELRERSVVAMALPESAGGDGAGLVEVAIVVEEAGRRAAPVPMADVLASARALARLDAGADLLARMRDRDAIVTIAPGDGDRRLVPSGGIAEAVLALSRHDLVLIADGPAHIEANLACAPVAWRRISDGAAVGSADDWAVIEREWHILTAAALVGLGQTALDLGVRYAKERTAFGVQIGSFQAVAHPLVDAANAVDAARRLVWRAAWFSDNEPESVGALALCALVAAGDAADKAGATAIHTQGGFGFTLESDVQLYYRRAKGWAALAGHRPTLLRRIAKLAPQSTEVGQL
ncbi:acyl-CoA dehydrogenase family protein [Mycolicibacterium moriokaense]|uniref:Alkylation response protein AidB-like acyl-CoA dehydrogenase n=1 Tax=Mycolicibacterium moriokaense TaxID=39691 RepID=A0A318H8I1_9MYCO|nr:acyl-CoA dehydrogenase family protein [Mycolicibacterium moriokaense]PXX01626.1 alkylation response protein AidB-like acyl-CoA dehydrogenase [Mycolicibacterium moriokaense]